MRDKNTLSSIFSIIYGVLYYIYVVFFPMEQCSVIFRKFLYILPLQREFHIRFELESEKSFQRLKGTIKSRLFIFLM